VLVMLAPPGTGELVFGLHIHEHRLFKSSIVLPRVRRAWTSERSPESELDLAWRREVVTISVWAAALRGCYRQGTRV
jgi:hypothetical protein